MIRLPSGREFKFPNTKRTASGGATNATKIKNYPVQSFATADLVPLCLVNLRNEIKKLGLSALIVNTVHDSVLLDCPKDEVEKVEDILGRVLSTSSIDKMISDFYDISMTVPLEIEHKVGRNWMEMS
jgi:DNA polymerase-1